MLFMRYRKTSPEDLRRIDRALAFAHGSFVAASKLVDMDPDRFRNVINGNPWLKARWGRRKRGRGVSLPFHIEPYREYHLSLGIVQDAVAALPVDQQFKLVEWLRAKCDSQAPAKGEGALNPSGQGPC